MDNQCWLFLSATSKDIIKNYLNTIRFSYRGSLRQAANGRQTDPRWTVLGCSQPASSSYGSHRVFLRADSAESGVSLLPCMFVFQWWLRFQSPPPRLWLACTFNQHQCSARIYIQSSITCPISQLMFASSFAPLRKKFLFLPLIRSLWPGLSYKQKKIKALTHFSFVYRTVKHKEHNTAWSSKACIYTYIYMYTHTHRCIQTRTGHVQYPSTSQFYSSPVQSPLWLHPGKGHLSSLYLPAWSSSPSGPEKSSPLLPPAWFYTLFTTD